MVDLLASIESKRSAPTVSPGYAACLLCAKSEEAEGLRTPGCIACMPGIDCSGWL